MNTSNEPNPKALVTVFEDQETATRVIERLIDAGFAPNKIELVAHRVESEAPEVETPPDHETTGTSLVSSAEKWGAMGAGTGLIAGLLTPFPGLGLGMAIVGGLTGAIVGGIAGVDHSSRDDSVNLPSLEEYDELVKNGNQLVVVLGTHEQALRAEEIVKEMSHVRSHIHPVHGHLYHEHPAHQSPGS